MLSPDDEQEYEGVFVAQWEIARFVVVRGRKFFGLLPRVERWLAHFPPAFEPWLRVGRDQPRRHYAMRVRGRLGPRGSFGHRGICRHELFVSAVLACAETNDPGPTW